MGFDSTEDWTWPKVAAFALYVLSEALLVALIGLILFTHWHI